MSIPDNNKVESMYLIFNICLIEGSVSLNLKRKYIISNKISSFTFDLIFKEQTLAVTVLGEGSSIISISLLNNVQLSLPSI